MNILLDYVFPITIIEPTPAASTAFLKQVCVVVKPRIGITTGEIVLCTSKEQVHQLTDNRNADQLFNAGMSRVYVLPMNNLQLASVLENASAFYTVLISDDFSDSDIGVDVPASLDLQSLIYESKLVGDQGDAISIAYVDGAGDGSATVTVADNAISVLIQTEVTTAQTIKTAIEESVEANALVRLTLKDGQAATAQEAVAATNLAGGITSTDLDVGSFEGVVGVSSTSNEVLFAQSKIKNRCAFYGSSLDDDRHGAANMFYAFGSLLSNLSNWRNQQYVSMPESDSINDLGLANLFFDERVSFVITDSQYANRLAFFVAGQKAIVAPYILKNLCVNLQSAALQWIALNQPDYTVTDASLLESHLQETVIEDFIERRWLSEGNVAITINEGGNFVANGAIDVPQPKALWRVFSELRESI